MAYVRKKIIFEFVEERLKFNAEDLKQKKGRKGRIQAKHVTAYLLQKWCRFDLGQISRMLNYRDRRNVIYACSTMPVKRRRDRKLNQELLIVESKLLKAYPPLEPEKV